MKFYLAIAIAIALSCVFATPAKASHAMGADLFYDCVGRDSFRITLNLYRDCDGQTAPTTAAVSIFGCAGTTINLSLARNTVIQPYGIPNGSEVSPLCSANIANSTCNGGNLPGVQQYQYSILWVAPAQCNWRVSFDLNARNGLINTLQNPEASDMYIEAYINNTSGICNNSPRFTSIPVPFFCYQDNVTYSQGAFDPDGDSLVFTMIQPLQSPGVTVVYAAGFSVNNPLSTNNTFTFNSQTGQMSFTPQVGQVGVISVRVDEYRNGVLIGSTMRDIEVVVFAAPICTPPYSTVSTNGISTASLTGGNLMGPFAIEACPGDTIRFTIGVKGIGSALSSDVALTIPGATFDTIRVAADSIYGRFTWVPSAADAGLNNFTLSYGPPSCPVDRISNQSISIRIIERTSAGPDLAYCTQGVPAQLSAIGGSAFTWSPAAGLSSTSISNPIATPTATTDYIVQSNLSSGCTNRDTVRVTVVPNFTLSPSNDTLDVCTNAGVTLDVQANNAFAPYTYTWAPATGLSNTGIANPVASPYVTTNYTVTVTSAAGCTRKDSILLNIIGNGPQIIPTPQDVRVCNGSSVQLNATVVPVTCGTANGQGYCTGGNSTTHTLGNGTTASAVTPFSGASSDGRYQVLYKASDLQALGITAGTITSLQFTVQAKASNLPYSNLTISMGCTSASQLTRSNWIANTTQVYSAANYSTVMGANTFILTQPYNWDGISNLVIEFCHGNANSSNAGGNDLLRASTVTYFASMSAIDNASNGGCGLPSSAISVNHPTFQVPNLTFGFCRASYPTLTYQWSPATGLSNPNILNPLASPNQTTTYTLAVSDSVCSARNYINVQVDGFGLSVSNDTSFCVADTVQLLATISGLATSPCWNNGTTCTGNLDTVAVGTGTANNTSSTYPSPYSNYSESVKQQYLYKASDLLAAGVSPGRITALGFNILVLQGTSIYRNFSIKVKCTSISTLTQGSPEGGNFVTVFLPKNVSIPSSGWTKHTLDNGFDWDGTSNILLEVCFNNDTDPTQTTNITANARVLSTITNYTASTWYPVDNQDACSGALGLPASQGSSVNRPNIRLYTCTGAAYSVVWSPSTNLTDPTILNPIATPNSTTTYYVVATSGGCSRTDSVNISIAGTGNTAQVTITSNPLALCAGDNATFTAIPVFGGATPSYQWRLNGNIVGTNSPTLTLNNLPANAVISCVLTSSLSCLSNDTALSNSIVVTPNGAVPSVSITSNSSPACSDLSTSFTAQPVNGGASPIYQWKVNGNNVGSNNQTIVLNGLSAGDVVTVTLTSSNPCVSTPTAVSNGITIVGSTIPSISIAAALPSGQACAGTASFTAQVQNEGTAPVYQWKLNGTNVGTSIPTLTLNNLRAGDIVSCNLTSNAPCATSQTVTSNGLTIQDTVTPTIMISPTPFPPCAGLNSITFRSIVNLSNRPTYQWKLNGNNVGTDVPAYVLYSLSAGDVITCEITASGNCLTSTTAISNSIIITTCIGIDEVASLLDFQVQPNPSAGMFFLNAGGTAPQDWSITVYDLAGREIMGNTTVATGLQQYPLDLSGMAKGVYILRVSNGSAQGHQRLVVY